MLNEKEIRKYLLGATEIPEKVMNEVFEKRCLQIWVPQIYGGLGLGFSHGLQELFNWAKIDGSLGWMLTLCSGANYFSRNMKPQIAAELFANPKTCFGGSGMVGGTAEILADGNFLINGLWHFATGAPHLSHFTLNAKIMENGQPKLDEQGKEMIRSFIIPACDAEIIPNWKAMGMKATGTYSFKIENKIVNENFSFLYDSFYTDDVLDRIPFRVFAYLTLLVNYLGMAAHFVEEAKILRSNIDFSTFEISLSHHFNKILHDAKEVENLLSLNQNISVEKQSEIHVYGVSLVQKLSHQLLDIYIQMGVPAIDTQSEIYQIFSDYFTAAMHSNFRPESDALDFSF